MRTMIEGYENRTGEHCGSIAMRNLLQHYCHLDLSESLIFGRSASMEADVADTLGVDYVE